MSPVKSPEDFTSRKQEKIVVGKDETEELPSGWTKEMRMRKKGSVTKVDRFYTDPVTGYIFHSLKDVQRYLKTGELGRLATKPKMEEREKLSELKEQMSETLTNKRAPTDKSESPARASKRLAGINGDAILPEPPLSLSQPKTRQATQLAGIKVDAPSASQSLPEPKTRQATRLAGVVVDASLAPPEPKTRHATRIAGMEVDASPSSPEPTTRQATRLVEVAADASLPSPSLPEPKTRQATRAAGVAVDALLSPSEPKTRQAKRAAGVAVDASPSSSEPKNHQATRLAGMAVDVSLPSPSPPESKTHQATRLSEVAVGASLPSPSLPKPKTRQAARIAGVAVDASLSLLEPKTRQATRAAGVAVDASPSSPEPKTRQATRLAELIVDAPSQPEPKTHQGTRLKEMTVDAALPSPSPPDTRSNYATKQTGNKIDASVPLPPPAVSKTCQAAHQAGHQAGIKINSPSQLPPDSYTHQATQLKGTEIGSAPPSQPEPKTRQAKRAAGIRDNASPSRPKTRRATQQAGIKIYLPPPSLPDTRTSRQATRTRQVRSTPPEELANNTEAEKITDKHNNNAEMDANANHNQEKSITTPLSNQESNEKQELRKISPPATPKEHNKQIETVPTTSQPHEAQPPPMVIPPLNLEKQESCAVLPTVSNQAPQDTYGSDMKPGSSINFSMNDLWTDPCIEFAVKTLTGAIPFTDINKVENCTVPSEAPLQEIWTDPCIEFAVKTLTGAIPVGEDDYFRHRPAGSSNPQGSNNFSSPMNVCQTVHMNKQHDAIFPTLGNGDLQKSVKFVNGSNGQCSRSRFIQ